MTTTQATAEWKGTLKEGQGFMSLQSGAYDGPYTFASRFETGEGTNPEEFVGAALAGCYSMFLSALLSDKGYNPASIQSNATVVLGEEDGGPKITSITLDCQAKVDGVSEEEFQELAASAKINCPISKLYAGTTITANAQLMAPVA